MRQAWGGLPTEVGADGFGFVGDFTDAVTIGFEAAWTEAAVGPIEQFYGVHDRDIHARLELRHAANVSSGDNIRRHNVDVCDFPIAQLAGKFRLEHIVGPDRATADMAFRDLQKRKTGFLE